MPAHPGYSKRNPKFPCVPHFFEELRSHSGIRTRECERTVVEIKVLHEEMNALNSFANLLVERAVLRTADEGCYWTMIVVSKQEPMNPSGRLCRVIRMSMSFWLPCEIMTSVVNPASFQVDCA